MNVYGVNMQNIPNFNQLLNCKFNIQGVKKIEERICYDAYWEVYTDLGTITLKMFDGLSEKEFLNQCKKCTTVSQLLDIQPKCFYYD